MSRICCAQVDECRVKLADIEGNVGSDYINASYIKVSLLTNFYKSVSLASDFTNVFFCEGIS